MRRRRQLHQQSNRAAAAAATTTTMNAARDVTVSRYVSSCVILFLFFVKLNFFTQSSVDSKWLLVWWSCARSLVRSLAHPFIHSFIRTSFIFCFSFVLSCFLVCPFSHSIRNIYLYLYFCTFFFHQEHTGIQSRWWIVVGMCMMCDTELSFSLALVSTTKILAFFSCSIFNS